MEMSDQNRKGLFKGSGIDYIRMRAQKHRIKYGMYKQADHLDNLADELEAQIKNNEKGKVHLQKHS